MCACSRQSSTNLGSTADVCACSRQASTNLGSKGRREDTGRERVQERDAETAREREQERENKSINPMSLNKSNKEHFVRFNTFINKGCHLVTLGQRRCASAASASSSLPTYPHWLLSATIYIPHQLTISRRFHPEVQNSLDEGPRSTNLIKSSKWVQRWF